MKNMLHQFRSNQEPVHTRKHEIAIYLFLALTSIILGLIFYTVDNYSEVFQLVNKKPLSPVTQNHENPNQSKTKLMHRETIGFLPSWSIAQNAIVHTEYLDQIIYFGIGIDETGTLMKIDNEGNELIEWKYFRGNEFKNIRKSAEQTNTKILIAIKNFDNVSIDTLISSDSNRNRAVLQISRLVDDYDLDGVNIDFEYFTQIDFPTMKFYNQFLQELSTSLKETNSESIISVDVNATAVYQDNAYDMVKIGDVVDQVIVMGYDFHRPISTRAGPVAPLDSEGDTPSLSQTINSLRGRVESNKVILGIPLYGYEWQTYTIDYASKTVPDSGAVATYKRVRELLTNRDDLQLSYDPLSQSPRITYFQNGLIKQIYYEDDKSIQKKLEFIKENELAGVALWTLGYEGDYIDPWNIIKDFRKTK